MWSDETTLWVADYAGGDGDKLYAYTLATGRRDTTQDVTLDADNTGAVGLWSDGTTLWVSDFDDDTLYAYDLTTGSRDDRQRHGCTRVPARAVGERDDAVGGELAEHIRVQAVRRHVATRAKILRGFLLTTSRAGCGRTARRCGRRRTAMTPGCTRTIWPPASTTRPAIAVTTTFWTRPTRIRKGCGRMAPRCG